MLDPPIQNRARADADRDRVVVGDGSRPSDETGEPIASLRLPRGYALVRRRAIYVQAAALALVAFTALFVGVRIGQRHSGAPRISAAEPLTLSGTIVFAESDGTYRGDAGATALVVPVDVLPSPRERVSAQSLLSPPADRDSFEASRRAIAAMGGDCAQAASAGRFHLRVPRPGDYWLLVVSAHMPRPGATELPRTDVAQVGRYVFPPTDLLNRQRYQWRRVRLDCDQRLDVALN